jgi:predicted dehydrogenase
VSLELSTDAVNTYRAAIIGCGDVGSTIGDDMLGAPGRWVLPHGHAPSYEAAARVELVAGAEIDDERRQTFGDRWDIAEHVYSDYREMLAAEQPDIVSVATPTPMHEEMALAAVEAGVKAIFLEKPIASNLAGAGRVVAACADAGIPLAVNHTRRGDAVYRKVAELAQSGAVGELHSMMMLFPSRLMWIGTHGLDIMNFVAGDVPVRWVSGEIQEGGDRDPGGNAIFEYENGARGFINGFRNNSVGFRLHVIGSEGEIVISRYDLKLWRNRPGSHMGYEPVVYAFPQSLNYASPMVKLIEELVEAIEGGPEPVSNGQTALRALEQIVGLYCSSRQDCRRVRVPEDLDRSLTIDSL